MKKAIIIGASSGIGRELAKVMSVNGYTVGLVARRLELLSELQSEIPARTYVKRIDISRTTEAMGLLTELIEEMNGTDVLIICSAISPYNPDLNWENEIDTINVNVAGVTAMANVAYNYFCVKGTGHLVGISSFKALRGGGKSPAYNASKAFLSNYLEGLRIKLRRAGKNIVVTDIRPGFVNNSGTKRKNNFFVVPVETVALQIYKAIEKKESIAYVPKRYGIVACFMRNMPLGLYCRL